jgi:non-ribosomal peptide synthetase component F
MTLLCFYSQLLHEACAFLQFVFCVPEVENNIGKAELRVDAQNDAAK